jgi:hypothetical protein
MTYEADEGIKLLAGRPVPEAFGRYGWEWILLLSSYDASCFSGFGKFFTSVFSTELIYQDQRTKLPDRARR